MFKKATKEQSRLRLAIIGISGSGKTYSALEIGKHLGGPVAVIDTERGSASKYADLFDFDTVELESFHPQKYIDAINEAQAAGYKVLIIDSLSHAWMGKDGVLEFVDKRAKQLNSANSFAAWRDASPLHNQLVDAILACKLHVIVTMRAKTEYSMDKDERGKTVIRKMGLAAVQRDSLEYEFDIVGEMTSENEMIITKTRCAALTGQVFSKPGKDFAGVLNTWLTTGAPASQPANTNSNGNGNGHKTEGTEITARTKRAKLIAAMGLVSRVENGYLVKSPTRTKEQYEIYRDQKGRVLCKCADFEAGSGSDPLYRCEHILAVKYHLEPPTEQAEIDHVVADHEERTLNAAEQEETDFQALLKEAAQLHDTLCTLDPNAAPIADIHSMSNNGLRSYRNQLEGLVRAKKQPATPVASKGKK